MLNTPLDSAVNFHILLVEQDKKNIGLIQQNLVAKGVLRNHLAVCQSIEEAIVFLKNRPEFTTVLLGASLSKESKLAGLKKMLSYYREKVIIILEKEEKRADGGIFIKSGAQDFLLEEAWETNKLWRAIYFAVERKYHFQVELSEKVGKASLKNQELYKNIFNKSKDAIYICNLEGKLVDFNQATFELFAFSEEELIEIEVHDLFQTKEKKREFLYSLVANESVIEFPIEIEQKNGKIRDCLISASMIQNGEFIGYSGIIRDVTEQLKAEELKKARDIARQSAKMKEQFIANISHEMRTPMNAIWGMSNLVMQTNLSKDQKSYISSIKQSSEILLSVVNDILAISEIQNSDLKFNYQFFDLYELLYNLMNLIQYKAGAKKVSLSLEMAASVPRIVNGDKVRLKQILYNLALNAIKYTREGSVKVYVENLNQSNDFVQLNFVVSDTGVGIPSDKIDAIFETFTLIREKGKIQEGTGLGLPIAKNLVEQQGGKIGVSSKLGKGSKFYFDLLFEIGEEKFSEHNFAESTAISDEQELKVLLVEDHKMNQLVAIKTLEKYWKNIEILVANDGKECIAILAENEVDIILMDIKMPNMNGYDATAYIRHKMPPKKAEIPILAMTAHAHVAKNEKFRDYGMDDCIIKPFEPKDLFNKITEYTFKYKELVKIV